MSSLCWSTRLPSDDANVANSSKIQSPPFVVNPLTPKTTLRSPLQLRRMNLVLDTSFDRYIIYCFTCYVLVDFLYA